MLIIGLYLIKRIKIMTKNNYILDTSALIYDPVCFKSFKNSSVIIPITVLDELDKLKKQSGEAGRNARVCIKLLDDLCSEGDISYGISIDNDITVKIDATHYDATQYGDALYGDNRILACANFYNSYGTAVLVTNDINLRVRARVIGISAQSCDTKSISFSELYNGVTTIDDEDLASELLQRGWLNPSELPVQMCLNEYVVFAHEKEKIAIGRKISVNKIKLVKDIYPWDIAARNSEQSCAIDLIMDPNVSLVTLIGKAGTGKSLITLASALEMVTKKVYNKFVIYRPIQAVGNDIGYLPGPQPLDAKILTPSGWSTMGDIQPNNFVIGSDGKSKKVLKIFPKGKKEVFKVIFSDGSSTECCDDHLWFTTTLKESQKNDGIGSVKSLKEIRETLKTYNARVNNHKIPLISPVSFNEIDVIIDPYIMGILLGDGTLSEDYSVYFTSSDTEIMENCNNHLPSTMICKVKSKSKDSFNYSFIMKDNENRKHRIENIFNKEIKKYGLLGLKSSTKFIPDDYKFNSIKVRLSILQGLMDTDGFVSKNGSDVSYSTTSEKLAQDVQYLVQSLGGISNINNKTSTYEYNGEIKTLKSKVVSVSLPKGMCPFRLTRKIERFKSRKYKLSRMIIDVVSVGIKEVKCILVESDDHLYATDNFILTHNTQEEKLAPWFEAIMDNFEVLLNGSNGNNWIKDFEMFKKKGQIEMQALTYIRGRSIPNAIILVDECFPAKQNIATENGKETIGNIYNKFVNGQQLPLVKSYNETSNKFELKKILNAWNRGKKKLIEIKCSNRKIKCTENHKFLTNMGWKESSGLVVGDLIKTSEPVNHQLLYSLNSDQKQIILGSFLGDGNISNHGLSRFRLRMTHSFEQRKYCEWKAFIFGAKVRLIENNGYAKNKAIAFSSKMFGMNEIFPKTKTHCPQWILNNIDARGLAIWFMDDGSVNSDFNGARISTCSFDEDSQQRIVNKLISLGIECSYKKYKGYFYININKSGYVNLSQLIAPFMHKSMNYKCEQSNIYIWNHQYDIFGYTVVDAINYLDTEVEVYDIEVEDNHNFIICSSSKGINATNSGLIAHNCQNLSKEDVKTILTRAGEDTKIILTGDIEQIDNNDLDATNNGLTYVIDKFKDSDLAGHVTFTKGERSRLATVASEIL